MFYSLCRIKKQQGESPCIIIMEEVKINIEKVEEEPREVKVEVQKIEEEPREVKVEVQKIERMD